jgi:23S rRNA G2445 N2-methylase RlmL
MKIAAALLLLALQRPTPDIHFVPTSPRIIDAMLSLAQVTASDVVYDLGSGDGRIVIAAAQKYGARAVGVELDPMLVQQATRRARKAGVADKVSFRQEDLFKTDISDATVVMLYLSPSTNFRLEMKLMTELRPGTRVVSHRFEMPGWMPDREVRVSGTKVFLWTIKGGR